MLTAYYIVSLILIITTILPRLADQHWFFRVWDFGKVQLVILHIIVLGLAFLFIEFSSWWLIAMQVGLGISLLLNVIVLLPFTPLYKTHDQPKSANNSASVSIISVNVYQFNDEYQKLLDLVEEIKPDILLTMESNYSWDQALKKLDKDYKYSKKIPQENTYGMHFFTNLEIENIKVNHFVAEDIPSIECTMKTQDGWEFVFYGVHPPPPSPTEEETSKERDGELLSIAKIVKDLEKPVVVCGDFNNVAWANSSMLFKRVSQLIDPRVGRGFVSTFHADYWYMRFPIDLFFHSKHVYIEDFKTLRHIGSDHFPLFSKFYIGTTENPEAEHVDEHEEDDMEEMEEMIEEGKKENGDRDPVATEY